MFDTFKKRVENAHDYARDWKDKTGGKVMGYFCTYAPEEIMYAAGILPVRILGSREPQSVTEPHIFGMYCPWCRDCLAQGLQGRYDYLSGIMMAQSCLHLRQTYSSWKIHLAPEFAYYLPMPNHVQSPRALPFLIKELEDFKKSLEDFTGKKITDQDLENAIEVYDASRRMMKQIYEVRKEQVPLVSGTEAMYMVLASQVSDKAEHNKELEKAIASLATRKPPKANPGIRLLQIGSEQNDPDFVDMVESLDAMVVIDEHCGGTRYFWNETPKEGSPLERIAARYINRPACPSKDWPARRRLDHIKNLVKEYDVQGVMLVQQKFCDPHEADMPVIEKMLKEIGIPSYPLELDINVPYGQFKIRLEAFIEMISDDLLF
jgi:benzoyl-CoA reductase subunit C